MNLSFPPVVISILLLICSNVFMTFAWYAHLKELNHKPWFIAALISWGIALFEYLLQVPANRIGHTTLSVGQLKIMQEVITLTVFVPFALLAYPDYTGSTNENPKDGLCIWICRIWSQPFATVG